MKKNIIGIIAVVVIVGFGVGFMLIQNQPVACDTASAVKESSVTFTNDGVSRNCIIVTSGSKITWVNSSDQEVHVSTDPHPIHTGNKEISNNEFVLKVAPGQQAEVTLTKRGKFGHHDHLSPAKRGTIIVQ